MSENRATSAESRPRRRYRRRTVRIEIEYDCEAGPDRGSATTLGAGGLFIPTEKPLAKGSRLQLRFALPGSQRLHDIAGRVVWSNPAGGSAPHAHGMGIEFTDRYAAGLLALDLEAMD